MKENICIIRENKEHKKFSSATCSRFSGEIQGCIGSWGTQILNGTKKNCKKFQLGEVPLGDKNFILGRTIFSNFVGGKNLSSFIALHDLK